MSLKSFHLLFISLSVLMCLASAVLIGVLAFQEAWAIPGIAGALVASGGLIVYRRSFVRRYRNVLQGS